MSTESARKFYDSARTEILTRMKLRDNVILVFLGATSTLFAVAIKSATPEILFCVPYLSIGVTMIIAQHYMVIGRLAYYCAKEIGPFLEQRNENAPQWDASSIFHDLTGRSIILRNISCNIMLGLPTLMALIITFKHALKSTFPYGPLWWLSLICFLVTMVIVFWIHSDRKNLYRGDWPWPK